MRHPSTKALQAAVDRWNRARRIGTPVTLRKDGGETVQGETTSEAYILSGHSAVIHVSGVRGCYLLDRVTALPKADQAEAKAA